MRNEKPDKIQSNSNEISNTLWVYFDNGKLMAMSAMFKI